jgi:methylmalonyl-CoA mutase
MSALNAFEPASESDWRREAEAALKGRPLASLTSRTEEGIAIAPLSPGRGGVKPLHQVPGFAIAQRLDHPDAALAARQAIEDVENGAEALTIILPGPVTARGFGLDEPLTSIEPALAGIELDLIDVSLEGASFHPGFAQKIAALCLERRYDAARLRIGFGLDPIGVLNAGRHWREAEDAAMRDAAELAAKDFSGPFLLSDGRLWHESGAGEAQEIGLALAAGLGHMRLLRAAGFTLADAFAGVAFILAADADRLLTIAKFRALARLWMAIRHAYGLDPAPLRIRAETSFRMLTRLDAAANILRNAIAASSAVIGGADAVSVLPHTSALGLPDAAARRIARNALLILRDEAGIGAIADPAAGSGTFEELTEAIADQAWALFQRLERKEGGLAAALQDGSIAREIAEIAEIRRRDVAEGRRAIIGVTAYQAPLGDADAVASIVPRPSAATLLPALRLAEALEAAHAG